MDAKNTRIWLGCLAVGHVVVLSVLAWVQEAGEMPREPLFILCVSQVCLLGIWIGLRECTWPWRIGSVVYGIVWISVIVELSFGILGLVSEARPFLLLVAFLMLICRVFVARPELSDQPINKSPPRRFQYSILHLIILTTVVAVCLTLRNLIFSTLDFLGVLNSRVLSYDFFLAAIFIFIVPSFLAVWSALGKGRPLFRISIVLPFIFLWLFFIMLSFNNFVFSWERVIRVLTYTFPTVVIFLSLLVVQSCGYRLVRVRWKKPGQDSDEPIGNNAE